MSYLTLMTEIVGEEVTEEAICNAQRAVELTPEDHPNLTGCCTVLEDFCVCLHHTIRTRL